MPAPDSTLSQPESTEAKLARTLGRAEKYAEDMHDEWKPSEAAFAAARRVFSASPDVTSVVFPMVHPGKMRGFWLPGQRVRTLDQFPLPCGDNGFMRYDVARNMAAELAEAALASMDHYGTCGWAVIEPDGYFRVTED